MDQRIVYSILLTILFLSLPLILQPKKLENLARRPPPGKLLLAPLTRSKSEPQQVHISLVGKDHMRVSWVTEHKHTNSTVEYGTVPGNYNAAATGEHTSYRYLFYESGKIHHVTIGPLAPNTTYYYQCGGSGPEFSFRTPPSMFPVEFVVVGDLGQTMWTKSTLKHVESKDYDVFLLPGDLAYANKVQRLWDSFGHLVEPYASQRPWMVTQGNHEVETFPIIIRDAFRAYNARWQMPYEQSNSTSNLYYSFEVAGTHVVMLGSYTDFDSQSDQYKWLEADLMGSTERGRRGCSCWYMCHGTTQTWLTSKKGREGMRKAVEELVYKARVDVVFSGHVHAYERFTRIYNEKADPCGPVYMTIGDGGNKEGLAFLFKQPPSPLSLFREPSFGHARLRVVNETHAHWSWHSNKDVYEVKADQLWLENLSANKNCWESSEPSIPSNINDVHEDL